MWQHSCGKSFDTVNLQTYKSTNKHRMTKSQRSLLCFHCFRACSLSQTKWMSSNGPVLCLSCLCIRAGGTVSSQKRLWQNWSTDSSFLRSRRLMSEKEVGYSTRQIISKIPNYYRPSQISPQCHYLLHFLLCHLNKAWLFCRGTQGFKEQNESCCSCTYCQSMLYCTFQGEI